MKSVTITPDQVRVDFESPCHKANRRVHPQVSCAEIDAMEEAGFGLGEAVPFDSMKMNQPYAIRDNSGRWLLVNNAKLAAKENAILGSYLDNKRDLFPIVLQSDGGSPGGPRVLIAQEQTGASHVMAQSIMKVDNPNGTEWSRMDWAKPDVFSGLPDSQIIFTDLGNTYHRLQWASAKTGETFTLTGQNANKSTNLIVQKAASPASFQFLPIQVNDRGIQAAVQKCWPNAAEIKLQYYEDSYYIGITPDEAKTIWNNSKLGGRTYRPHVFDCDDFSYVYKAQASIDAYNNNMAIGFAVGVVFGDDGNGNAHAANIFFDPTGAIYILEPQNGTSTAGGQWRYTPFFIMM